MRLLHLWKQIGFVLLLLLTWASSLYAQEHENTPLYVETEGAVIHYRVFGEGLPLLLINSGPGWSSDHMVPVAERLARTHRVVLFDQRGTGLSEPVTLDSTTITMQAMIEDIEVLRTRLAIDGWIVMGHSFGGLLAMAYAAQHPQPVDALILSAPAGATLDFLRYYPASLNDRMQPHEREAVAFWSDSARMAANPQKAAYEIVQASVGAFLYNRSRLPDILAYITEATWSIPTSTLVWEDLTRIGFDVREAMRSFERPVLVVQGRQDALGDLHAYQVSQLFPHATFKIIEESAHILWLDQEEHYYDVLYHFLDTLE